MCTEASYLLKLPHKMRSTPAYLPVSSISSCIHLHAQCSFAGRRRCTSAPEATPGAAPARRSIHMGGCAQASAPTRPRAPRDGKHTLLIRGRRRCTTAHRTVHPHLPRHTTPGRRRCPCAPLRTYWIPILYAPHLWPPSQREHGPMIHCLLAPMRAVPALRGAWRAPPPPPPSPTPGGGTNDALDGSLPTGAMAAAIPEYTSSRLTNDASCTPPVLASEPEERIAPRLPPPAARPAAFARRGWP